MAAAYGVPLGGALFALEVMRGVLALRYVLPALFTSLVAGPIAGLALVGYVRIITWADRNKPHGWRRITAPVLVLSVLGAVSIRFPQLLGKGKDISQLAFSNQVEPVLLLVLLVLRPLATTLCVHSGAPGGLFTPSLTVGASLGAVLGHAWSWFWPGVPPGLFALLGAAAVLAATT